MQFFSQYLLSTLALDELLQNLEFFYATRLNSPRIVKNVSVIIGEDKFVVNIVLASLALCLKATEETYSTIFTNLHRWVKFNLFGSEIRLVSRRRGWTMYLLSPQIMLPVDNGTLRRFADSL